MTVTDAGGALDYEDLTITVNKEDAKAEYTGVQFARTTNINAGTVTINLRASIHDISSTLIAPTPTDNNPGNISKAWARSKIQEVVNSGTGPITYTAWKQVSVLDASNTLVGGISEEWIANIGSAHSISYRIFVQVGCSAT